MACCLEPNLDPELVIVARGGMVANDHGERIEGKRAEIIDASPDALAYASAGAGQPTLGQVGADDTRHDRGRGSQVVEDATAQSVSAIAASATGAAFGRVRKDRGVADRKRGGGTLTRGELKSPPPSPAPPVPPAAPPTPPIAWFRVMVQLVTVSEVVWKL